jgi:hypothetical protein
MSRFVKVPHNVSVDVFLVVVWAVACSALTLIAFVLLTPVQP